MIKTKVNTALRLSEILNLDVKYNSAENLYFIQKPGGNCAIVPAAKNQEAILKFLKEFHPEIML